MWLTSSLRGLFRRRETSFELSYAIFKTTESRLLTNLLLRKNQPLIHVLLIRCFE